MATINKRGGYYCKYKSGETKYGYLNYSKPGSTKLSFRTVYKSPAGALYYKKNGKKVYVTSRKRDIVKEK